MLLEVTGSQARSRSLNYWPEIDGLRSIAILSVFVFHFDRGILAGGFVGVDVFFVISGFLITSVLLNDIDQGQLSIARFYQRRIARIAPAFFVVIVAVLAASAFIYSAQDFASVGANSLAAALSAINMKLIFQGSYFKISPDEQPLLHYWSLAVEEQFYVVFPIYLSLILKHSKRPLANILIVCGLSFAACIVLTPVQPIYAFYLLPTRAWELLAGASLALFRRNGSFLAPAPAAAMGWTGTGLLAMSFLLLNASRDFPGWIAAFPVVGAVMILASIEPARGRLIQTILAHPLSVFIGKRSYSLYLWHWPVFCFVDYNLFASGPLLRTALKILICTIATLLTYKYIECPARTYLNARSNRQRAFAGFATAVLLVCLSGWQIRSKNWFSADPQQIATGGIAIEGSHEGVTVVLIGDSQGTMYGRELASLARQHGFSLYILSMTQANELPAEPGTHWPAVKQFLAQRRPQVVIVAEAWAEKLGNDVQYLRDALTTIESFGSQVILIAQPPVLPSDATREAIRAGVRPPFYEAPEDRANRQRATAAVVALANNRVLVLDPADKFLQQDGAIKLIAENGRLAYHDNAHLSDAGTLLIRPMLEQALLAALPSR
jgi:peptidoglycan/LPS O-acetylase OafA/YrhL